MKHFLDEYVIGQEAAKRTLSVGSFIITIKESLTKENLTAMLNLKNQMYLLSVRQEQEKHFLQKVLQKKLNVPFAIADATTLTEAGYVGEDVENILLKLIQSADNNIASAEKGIIYIDEIDKISRKGGKRVNHPGCIRRRCTAGSS